MTPTTTTNPMAMTNPMSIMTNAAPPHEGGWATDAVFYHLYPLGALGAPARNDLGAGVVPRLEALHGWLDHLAGLGVTALYLGPVFESTAHGYDTADYYHVDRRLGSRETLAALSRALHARGIRLVLDGVFHHVGRDFWAFRDLLANGRASRYRDWFHVDFDRPGAHGAPFRYEGWNGHHDLVKLNLAHPEVRAHLFEAVRHWIADYGIDGLRLDAADVMDLGFQRDLAAFCRSVRPDFWLMGEVIHGDYRRWHEAGGLDAVTNYALYKGLWSSHNDRNYFELAHTLDRQSGERGDCRGLGLYTFADNHDVDRVASTLAEPAHLYPLHVLLMTMPGMPSIYYGSEGGVRGKKAGGSDAPLRPPLDPGAIMGHGGDLAELLSALARLRRGSVALRRGDYRPLHVASEQLAFARSTPQEVVVVAANAAATPAHLELAPGRAGLPGEGLLVDALDGTTFPCRGGRVHVSLPPRSARVLLLR